MLLSLRVSLTVYVTQHNFVTVYHIFFYCRRNGLLLNHAFAVLGGLLCATCVHANQAALLFVGRFFLGLNCGITTGIAPMYLAEVAPRELRGTVAACNALGITLGDVVAYVATLSSTLNTNELWPIACGLCVVPAAISLLILPFCPESPRFLFMKKADEVAARKAFCRLNSNVNVEELVDELKEEMSNVESQPQFKFTHLFTRKDLRMPVLLACLLVMQQQFSGINAVRRNSVDIGCLFNAASSIPHFQQHGKKKDFVSLCDIAL
ncbi:unnamed protein product [Dicrocoelium dendriticum]|nr:unnamed protein product [Dicrocoelium dendriticum]